MILIIKTILLLRETQDNQINKTLRVKKQIKLFVCVSSLNQVTVNILIIMI